MLSAIKCREVVSKHIGIDNWLVGFHAGKLEKTLGYPLTFERIDESTALSEPIDLMG
ncbi:MAG: hypothetical protein ACR2QH_00285 [Geminicoccaceae bacterium]